MKQKIYLALLIAQLCSCSPVQQILESGKLNETNFIEKIPFNFDYGIPIINVQINGKSYRFLFDTGAPTILSPELAAVLNLKVQTDGKSIDSQGNSNARQYVVIPNLKLGNLNFENIGALVIDFNKTFEFRCVNLDGLIGSNQMAKAIWEIDYQNKTITASDQISNFKIDPAAQTINFLPKKGQLTPLVPVNIGNKTTYVTFDTGSSGDFNFSMADFKDELTGFKKIEAIGSSSTGVYGENKGTIASYVKVPAFKLGTLTLENRILEFQTNPSNVVGNSFLKNYRIVMNWNENKIYMIKQTSFEKNKINDFGAMFRYVNNRPTIAKIYKNSDAEKLGLLLNDEVVVIDGMDTSKFTESQACYYFSNHILNGKDNTRLTVLRSGRKIDFELKRTLLLD